MRAGIHHVHPAEFQAKVLPCIMQRFEGVSGHVGRDIDFPPQLSDIGDAVHAGEAHAESRCPVRCRNGLDVV